MPPQEGAKKVDNNLGGSSMWGALAGFLGSLFSSSKMSDTAVDAIRKMGGLDAMSDEQKAKFVLDYIAATKHQSPTRRLIALVLTLMYSLMLLVWLIAAGVGYIADLLLVMEYAGAVKSFMVETVMTPFNLILSFYFVMNIASKVGGGSK